MLDDKEQRLISVTKQVRRLVNVQVKEIETAGRHSNSVVSEGAEI